MFFKSQCIPGLQCIIFLKSANQKQELSVVAMFVNESELNEHLYKGPSQTWPPQTILVSDWLISKKSSPLKPFCQMNRNLVGSIPGRSSIANQKQELSVVAMFVNESELNEHLYKGPSKDASY
jgi:hypothetical protein